MDRPIALFELASLSPEARERLLVRSEADLAVFEERVKPIIDEVRRDRRCRAGEVWGAVRRRHRTQARRDPHPPSASSTRQ